MASRESAAQSQRQRAPRQNRLAPGSEMHSTAAGGRDSYGDLGACSARRESGSLAARSGARGCGAWKPPKQHVQGFRFTFHRGVK